MKELFLKLSEQVHPVALGTIFRTRTQIQMLADKLLKKHNSVLSRCTRRRIIKVLCVESGSHDYTVSRREARDELGLQIEKPDMAQYELLKKIHNDISEELELNSRYDPALALGSNTSLCYNFKRCLHA